MILTVLLLAVTLSTSAPRPTSYDVGPTDPAEEFAFAASTLHAGKYRFGGDDKLRRQILAALSRPNRDEALERLVPHTVIAGEKWFDLRGIYVGPGDIGRGASLGRICWDGSRFSGVTIDAADFSFALLRGVVFESCRLPGASFHQAYLECASFDRSDLRGASFKLARFGHDEAQFRFCVLDDVAFDNSRDLHGVYHGSASGATFTGAHLQDARFTEVDLSNASFLDADLSRADLFGSTVSGADFSRALLADAKLNFSRRGAPPRFNGTRIFRTELGGIDLKAVDVESFDWTRGTFEIGEEIRADNMSGRVSGSGSDLTRMQLYATAEVIYRTLAHAYRRLGYSEEYLQLRYRSLESRRKLLQLRPGSSHVIERTWLSAWHTWDRYGTSLEVVLARYVWVVLGFAVVYLLGWTVMGQQWAVWKVLGEEGRWTPGSATPPSEEYRRASGLRRAATALRLLPSAVLFSFVATVMFAEKLIDIRRVVDLIQMRDERLVPAGGGRLLVGVEAVLGALFLYSIVTRVVLLLPE